MQTTIGGRTFAWGSRVYVMGIVNVTPDSFGGDGTGDDVEASVALALRMEDQGADMIDVGGESTRPGHVAVEAEEELRRVMPVIERLAGRLSVPLSIDTYKEKVARAALDAGATVVNDVWGLQREPGIADAAAEHEAAVVVMHNQDGTEYNRDVLEEIRSSLAESARLAQERGVPAARVIVDPGIGFGKTWEHNLEVLRRLPELKELGYPILVGTSRKSFIGRLLGSVPPSDRLEGTAASVAAAVVRGADIVRVHDVPQMVRVVRVAEAIR